MSDACWIYVTFPDQDSAKQIAETLLAVDLVACANIIPGVTSMYKWKGQIETSCEVVAFFKVLKKKAEKTMAMIKGKHPYDCPAIILVDWDDVSDDYRRWMHGEV